MGQSQSSAAGGNSSAPAADNDERKTDYYELLGLERTAAEEECASCSSLFLIISYPYALCWLLRPARYALVKPETNMYYPHLFILPRTGSKRRIRKRPWNTTQTETMAMSRFPPPSSPRSRPPMRSYQTPRSVPGMTPIEMPSWLATIPLPMRSILIISR